MQAGILRQEGRQPQAAATEDKPDYGITDETILGRGTLFREAKELP